MVRRALISAAAPTRARRARAPHRSLAVSARRQQPGRCRPGDRPHSVPGRQAPPRDALVARRALRAVGPRARSRAQPAVVRALLPRARDRARAGLRGARWPKRSGPDGRESPSESARFSSGSSRIRSTSPSCCSATADAATLARYRDLVLETAEFLASFASDGRALLARPAADTRPGELPRHRATPESDVRAGLLALGARDRAALARAAGWPREGAMGSVLSTWRCRRCAVCEAAIRRAVTDRTDHPSMLAALGFLPGRR